MITKRQGFCSSNHQAAVIGRSKNAGLESGRGEKEKKKERKKKKEKEKSIKPTKAV